MKQKLKQNLKNMRGITLIALIVTIIVLIILAGVSLNLILGQNGIIKKVTIADEETVKQTATEAMNLKITSAQINTYAEKLEMPTLQELADEFCNDNDFEYVELQSKKVASLPKVNVGTNSSIFTKLKEYPYEFEINNSLQLASIDGVQVATAQIPDGYIEEPTETLNITENGNYNVKNYATANVNVPTVELSEDSFVGFFLTRLCSTSAQNIEIRDYNSNYVTSVENNVMTIKNSGKYRLCFISWWGFESCSVYSKYLINGNATNLPTAYEGHVEATEDLDLNLNANDTFSIQGWISTSSRKCCTVAAVLYKVDE